jgi:cytochrome c-type biogenesis protein CcmH/NrfF
VVFLVFLKNTTLSEQFQNIIEKQKIPHCRNSSKIQSKNKKYHTVGTVPKYNRKTKNTSVETVPKYNRKTKNTSVGTVPKYIRKTKNTTLSEQFQNIIEIQKIPHCRNSSKI